VLILAAVSQSAVERGVICALHAKINLWASQVAARGENDGDEITAAGCHKCNQAEGGVVVGEAAALDAAIRFGRGEDEIVGAIQLGRAVALEAPGGFKIQGGKH
jgi:hypothetical protein